MQLSSKIRYLTRIAGCRELVALRTASTIPFHYQDIFETTRKPDVPWKKLTGQDNILLNTLYLTIFHYNKLLTEQF